MVEKEKETNTKKEEHTGCGDNCGHDHPSDYSDTIKQMGDLLYHGNKNKKSNDVKDIYKFWDTQPVPKIKDSVELIGPIDDKNDWDAVRKEPLKLPEKYYWNDININDKKDLRMVSK